MNWNEEKTKFINDLMMDVSNSAHKNDLDYLERYLNAKWNMYSKSLQESERFPQIIRYHAMLDMLCEVYSHFFCESFDDGYASLGKVIDNMANKKIKEIQQEMTIYRLWLFD